VARDAFKFGAKKHAKNPVVIRKIAPGVILLLFSQVNIGAVPLLSSTGITGRKKTCPQNQENTGPGFWS
jgi:hypothetical protein